MNPLFGITLYAQKETFDIASFKPPTGWQRLDSNGVLAFHDTKATGFCQIYLYPSRNSTGKPATDFTNAWKDIVVRNIKTKNKPQTSTEKQPDGWTVVTGYTNVSRNGLNFTCMLVTASGFKKAMSVLVNVAGADYAAVVDQFFKDFDLDAKATAGTGTGTETGTGVSGSLSDLSFISPTGWAEQKGNGFTTFRKQYTSELACVLTIIAPQPSSGNLETDVMNVYNQMYTGGWRFYYTDHRKNEMQKGYTKQGLPFYTLRGYMGKDRPQGGMDSEEGCAAVIGTGNKMAIISARHEPTGMYCRCEQDYVIWGRFFNSFTIKNATPSNNNENIAKAILGEWGISRGVAINDYVFAANGHFVNYAGYGSTTRISSTEIMMKSSVFQGDGTYTISGDKLTMNKKGTTTVFRFRLVKFNNGGTGWKEGMYLFNEKPASGSPPYESLYVKK